MMLEAERAMAVGLLDQAERLYRQVSAADPKNSIAVVGLARVAMERGDERTAYLEARRALAMDPDNPMASHLVMRMAEVMGNRGEAIPDASETLPSAPIVPPPAPVPPAAPAPDGSGGAATSPEPAGLVDRLLRRRR